MLLLLFLLLKSVEENGVCGEELAADREALVDDGDFFRVRVGRLADTGGRRERTGAVHGLHIGVGERDLLRIVRVVDAKQARELTVLLNVDARLRHGARQERHECVRHHRVVLHRLVGAHEHLRTILARPPTQREQIIITCEFNLRFKHFLGVATRLVALLSKASASHAFLRTATPGTNERTT